jgi:hypothetical protein
VKQPGPQSKHLFGKRKQQHSIRAAGRVKALPAACWIGQGSMNEIHRTLYEFREDLQEIIEVSLRGIVIHGSYVLGDFRANLGDLDFITITETSLNEKTNRCLFSLHKKGYCCYINLRVHIILKHS